MRRRARILVNLITRKRGQDPALRKRVERLEAEVQELRRLNRRVAEIADIVQEVVVPAANRDDERVRRLLNEYSEGL